MGLITRTHVLLLVIVLLSAYCTETTVADFIEIPEIQSAPLHYVSTSKSNSEVNSEHNPNVYHRVDCEYKELTEDVICQEHCTNKGYTYGLCVSYTCTCV